MATNCHWLFVLHELPLMYHELSLIVLGILHQGGGMVPAAMSCQRGQVRWWASMAAAHRNPSVFIMKTRHCISGCGRVIHSGL